MCLKFVFCIVLVIHSATQERCRNKECNDESVCELEGDAPKCDCVGTTIFQGTNCMDLVDNCKAGLCKQSGVCNSYLGHYYCECPAGYGGQTCNLKLEKAFTGLHMHYNRLAVIGETQYFLITWKTLGDVPFLVELANNKFLADSAKYNKSTKWWHKFPKSNNLKMLARDLGLKHVDKMPYNSGYHRVATGQFWARGLTTLALTIFSSEDDELMYGTEFPLHVYTADPDECVLDIEVPHCFSPRPLMHVDIAQYTIVKPVVKERCSPNSVLKYRWSILNFVGKVTLHNYEMSTHYLLKIPPYRLWFEHRDNYQSWFQIRGVVYEEFENKRVQTVVRCFVFVDPKPVSAFILSGPEREVSTYERFIMDGSRSRDYAFAPWGDQHLSYRWSCSIMEGSVPSTDVKPLKDICVRNMGSSAKIDAMSVYMVPGLVYNFTLNVESIENPGSTDSYQQLIRLREEPFPLHLFIECVSNCRDNKYNDISTELVHLRARCLNCKGAMSTRQYKWSVSGVDLKSSDEKHLRFEPPAKDKIEVELQVVLSVFNGTTKLELQKNSPPTGECTIKPSSGTEFTTEFTVDCSKIDDDDKALYFQHRADDMLFVETYALDVKLRLPATSGYSTQACDAYGNCKKVTLGVSVTPFTPLPQTEEELEKFLQSPETDLVALQRAGKVDEALMLTYLLLGKLPISLDAFRLVYKTWAPIKLNTAAQAEQFTILTAHLVKRLLPLDNERAGLCADFFAKLRRSYKSIIADGEVRFLRRQRYETITENLLKMWPEFAHPAEEIPEVQLLQEEVDPQDPLSEHYGSLHFDIKVLPIIENWLRASQQLQECLRMLGIMASHMHKPIEGWELAQDELRYEVYALEENEPYGWDGFKDDADNIRVNLSAALVEELKTKLDTSFLLLQMTQFKKNPYWWYPDMHDVNTPVLFVSVFSAYQVNTHRRNLALQKGFDISMPLQKPPAPPKPFEDYLTKPEEMGMFHASLLPNAALVVKFLDTTDNVLILLRVGTKPRGYQVRESGHLIKAMTDSHTYVLHNYGTETRNGYLAVRIASTDEPYVRVNFTFVMMVRECLHWDPDGIPDPQWSTTGCVPFEKEADSFGDAFDVQTLHCYCRHLSSFSGKTYPAYVVRQYGANVILDELPFNWFMFTMYATLTLLCLAVLTLAVLALNRAPRNLLTIDISDDDARKQFHILVIFHTGGMPHAGTTANVHLSLMTRQGYRKFVIQQDPLNSQIIRHSRCHVYLPLTFIELQSEPMHLSIYQDGAGRYPSWYLCGIEVRNVVTHRGTYFHVEQWINTKPLEFDQFTGKYPNYWERFKLQLELQFVNWYCLQPILGPWLSSNGTFNRGERSLIWLSKLLVTLTIVTCYFGCTTLENYEEEREIYFYISLDMGDLVFLAVVTYVSCLLVHFGLRTILVRIK